MESIKKLEELARLAELAERYDDMCEAVKSIVYQSNGTLTPDQRNLFSVAYKNLVSSHRSAWRVISARYENLKNDVVMSGMLLQYKSQIEEEINTICCDVINLLDNKLFPMSQMSTDKSFYLKMKGDFCRYLSEVKVSDEHTELVKKSTEAYESAYKIILDELSPVDPIRLGMALSQSTFLYEIAGLPDKAVSIAKNAFDEAIAVLDGLEEDRYKDSTLIMQLLRDNLTLWTSCNQESNQND